jgi:hypothetical protein
MIALSNAILKAKGVGKSNDLPPVEVAVASLSEIRLTG